MADYDVVIVGGGILGLSTAYHVKTVHPDAAILVIDKLGSAGQGNTARSAAAFRCIFSSQTNYALADSSLEFYRHLEQDLGVDIKLQWLGYLWLLTEKDYDETSTVFKDLALKSDLKYTEYDCKELTRRLCVRTNLEKDEEAQSMGLEDIFGGILIPKAGVINDVSSLINFYETEFLRLGGKIQYNVEAKSLIAEPLQPWGISGEPYFWQTARAAGVSTNKGVIRAKKTVLAAGAWISRLLDPVGVECYIKPKKRQFFAIEAKSSDLQKLLFTKGFNSLGCLPFTILPSFRVYIRPFSKEGTYWVGYADDFPRAFKLEEDPQAEKNFYEYGIYQVLTKYFPQFRDVRASSAFAGLYEINTLDGHPVIFEQNDLMVVGGASGSGITKADAIGRIAEALYSEKEYASFYGHKKFKVSDLGLEKRYVEPEKLVL
ncbi:MAG: FAD-binding oxidoreductase [Candidatus Bathyarchaeia archaeon]|jgi:glycine/D-amino acid oxidase-like deaminating enzyme